MNNIKGDIFGGVTAAVIALPLALAFGVASGAGAIAGIYGAVILGFFAALFGGTSTQISGPTGPMTVVIASAVALFAGDINAVMCVIFLTGIFQIIFGLSKVGRYVKYIPYPVISGFMSGIGLIIIILQINPFLGLDGFGSVIQTIYNIPETLNNYNYQALILSVSTLAIMIFTPKKISKIIPTALLALIFMTMCSVYFGFDVTTIGEIPTSLPSIELPTFNIEQSKQILTLAITLALLGSIDSLLTSLVADSITKNKHNSNKELIGQGIGNTLVSLVGGIAGAGATMRTVINVKSGGRTRLSGIIHSITLLCIVIFLAPIASQIPLAVLAGILMKVGIDIVDYKFLKIINDAPKYDLMVMLLVFFLTVFVDLIIAVGSGIVLASMLIVYRISVESKINISFSKDNITNIINTDIRIIDIDGAFFFGSATHLEDKISQTLDTKKIIINCLNVPFIDISAIFALEEMIIKLQDLDIDVVLVLRDKHIVKLRKIDKLKIFKNVKIYKKLQEAVDEVI